MPGPVPLLLELLSLALAEIAGQFQTQEVPELHELLVEGLVGQLLLEFMAGCLDLHDAQVHHVHELTVVLHALGDRFVEILEEFDSLVVTLVVVFLKLEFISVEPSPQLLLFMIDLQLLKAGVEVGVLLFREGAVADASPEDDVVVEGSKGVHSEDGRH